MALDAFKDFVLQKDFFYVRCSKGFKLKASFEYESPEDIGFFRFMVENLRGVFGTNIRVLYDSSDTLFKAWDSDIFLDTVHDFPQVGVDSIVNQLQVIKQDVGDIRIYSNRIDSRLLDGNQKLASIDGSLGADFAGNLSQALELLHNDQIGIYNEINTNDSLDETLGENVSVLRTAVGNTHLGKTVYNTALGLVREFQIAQGAATWNGNPMGIHKIPYFFNGDLQTGMFTDLDGTLVLSMDSGFPLRLFSLGSNYFVFEGLHQVTVSDFPVSYGELYHGISLTVSMKCLGDDSILKGRVGIVPHFEGLAFDGSGFLEFGKSDVVVQKVNFDSPYLFFDLKTGLYVPKEFYMKTIKKVKLRFTLMGYQNLYLRE